MRRRWRHIRPATGFGVLAAAGLGAAVAQVQPPDGGAIYTLVCVALVTVWIEVALRRSTLPRGAASQGASDHALA